MVATGEPLLEVAGVTKHFPLTQGVLIKRQIGAVKAVDGVSFTLHRGETLGLVGESGCGKSTLSRTLLRLVEPTSGSAVFEGKDIFALSPKDLREMRRRVQIIFQDPYASLNPRMTVGDIVGEAFEIHRDVLPGKDRRKRVRSLLDRVGLNPDYENRYPHQFSGGQRQRIGVARALALNPDIIICDEPVSALDVSVQAQVINLLEEIQAEFDLSYIFIAHDLSVVRHIADRVAVMYLGRIVEIGNDEQIYEKPLHPYTQALLSAVPLPDPTTRDRRDRIVLEGDVPSPANPPSGCHFRTRCWKAEDLCAEEVPELIDRFDHGHPSRCHFAAPREHVLVAADEPAEVGVATADGEAGPGLHVSAFASDNVQVVAGQPRAQREADRSERDRRALRTAGIALWVYVGLSIVGILLVLPALLQLGTVPTVLVLAFGVAITVAFGFLAGRTMRGDPKAAATARNAVVVFTVVSIIQGLGGNVLLLLLPLAQGTVVAVLCHRAAQSRPLAPPG